MKKILIVTLLGLIISCGQKNYSKMSNEQLEKEAQQYQEKFMNNTLTPKEKLEIEKLRIIYNRKNGVPSKKIKNVQVDMKKTFEKMSMDELDSYIQRLEDKLYENGNLSDKEMEKREKALTVLQEKQAERTKQLMEERINQMKENSKKSKGAW